MAVVGVDLGSQSTKAVILEGDKILGGASMQTGESAETEARMAVQEALKQVGLKREDLKAAAATGPLSVPVTKAVNIAALKPRSAASCIATGAYFRFPQARTVLYVGADSSMAVRLSSRFTSACSSSTLPPIVDTVSSTAATSCRSILTSW